MNGLRVGALFAGYGGIELALHDVFDAEPAWFSEFEPPTKNNPHPSQAPSKILAAHWPDVPNHGDVTKIDWSAVAPVDIIAGGSPCQDLSPAGKRKGMRAGTRSGLWASMCDAIDIIRPSLVVWENVRGALSADADSDMEPCPGCVGGGDDGPVLRALGRVLGDLAGIGYDAVWTGLRAADVGAPHGRFRVFVLAWPAADAEGSGRRAPGYSDDQAGTVAAPVGGADQSGGPAARSLTLLPTPTVSDTNGAGVHGDGGLDLRTAVSLLPTPTATDGTKAPRRYAGGNLSLPETVKSFGAQLLPTPRATDGTKGGPNQRGSSGDLMLPSAALTDFGQYAPAIARWEALTRPAPSPTEPTGKGGAQRLSPAFVEWLMGLPSGWVTDVDVSRNDQLKALGNGVVPQQCAAAIRHLLTIRASVLAAVRVA